MSELQAALNFGDDEDQQLDDEQQQEGTEEQAAGASDEGEKKQEPGPGEQQQEEAKTVPHAALHEERMRRKELQAEVQSQRELMARMEERFKVLSERMEPKEQAPNYEEDPAAYLKYQTDQLASTVSNFQEDQTKAKEAAEQAAQLEAFRSRFTAVETEYAGNVPDYYEAIDHLRNARAAELTAFGYPPEQVQQAMQWDAHQLAHQAFQQGLNPAQQFYEMAKARGYTPKAAGAKPAQEKSEVEKLKTVAEGQKRGGSMGTSGSGNEEMTLAKLAQLTDEEFAEATKGKRWAQLWQ